MTCIRQSMAAIVHTMHAHQTSNTAKSAFQTFVCILAAS